MQTQQATTTPVSENCRLPTDSDFFSPSTLAQVFRKKNLRILSPLCKRTCPKQQLVDSLSAIKKALKEVKQLPQNTGFSLTRLDKDASRVASRGA
jgi:hypothetical protein